MNATAQASCPMGSYCAGLCARLPCAPGTFQALGEQTTCLDCSNSQFQEQQGATACKNCTTGFYRVNATFQAACEVGHGCSDCIRTACGTTTFQTRVCGVEDTCMSTMNLRTSVRWRFYILLICSFPILDGRRCMSICDKMRCWPVCFSREHTNERYGVWRMHPWKRLSGTGQRNSVYWWLRESFTR